MDIDENGISIEILCDSSDSSQGNCQMFISFKKCKDYSISQDKTLKIKVDDLSSDFKSLQDLGKVFVSISLSDESIQKLNSIKGVMDSHSIVIFTFLKEIGSE